VDTDCTETHLFRDRDGYGVINIGSESAGTRRTRPHHRVVYAEHHGLNVDGPEMKGMDVDHTCFNPACVNIEHLELVSHAENMRRSAAAGRRPISNRKVAKLTPYAVMWIRSYVQEGRTQAEVGEMFGVSQAAVSSIVRRKTWRDVA
jgi:hypothetical protein